MNKPENPQAFPVPTAVPGNAWMTLRDYFAGQALIGVLADKCTYSKAAIYAYQLADLMLDERTKQ